MPAVARSMISSVTMFFDDVLVYKLLDVRVNRGSQNSAHSKLTLIIYVRGRTEIDSQLQFRKL